MQEQAAKSKAKSGQNGKLMMIQEPRKQRREGVAQINRRESGQRLIKEGNRRGSKLACRE
jgi:hypothetical protein